MAVTRKPEPAHLFNLPPIGKTLAMIAPTGGRDCVVALKALGEDTRIRIVGLLMEQPMEVGEIARRLGVSQYNVSKHLRILREAGLLEVEKDGRRHLYALPEAIHPSTEYGLLDLGCCQFQFDDGQAGSKRAKADRRRKRAIRSATRISR